MKKENLIRIGDKVDVFLGRGRAYRTMLEDIDSSGNLLISTPLYRGIPVIMHKGQEVELYYFREDGRYCINTTVVDFILNDQIKLILLRADSEPKKQQRRESYRLAAFLETIIRDYASGDFPLKPDKDDMLEQEYVFSENISETGVALRTKQVRQKGDKVYLRIYLKWPEEDSLPIDVMGEIRQVELLNHTKQIYRIGIMFLKLPEETRRHIARYVLARQQQLLKLQ